MTLDDIAADLRARYPDPEERWIAAHRELKGETKTHNDYVRMREWHEQSREMWARLERIGA